MRQADDITRAMELHADTVLRVCTLYFPRSTEREDAFQETFLRYMQSDTRLADEEHRKAWLIRVAANVCKDMLKRADAKTVAIDWSDESLQPMWQNAQRGADAAFEGPDGLAGEVGAALAALDEKYRIVLYLTYYEGCTAKEIAAALDIPENTVYTDLARGRKKMKEVLTHGERNGIRRATAARRAG